MSKLTRVRVLCEASEVLDEATAGEVARVLVAGAGSAPWQGPSPRAWKARVERAVVRALGHPTTVRECTGEHRALVGERRGPF